MKKMIVSVCMCVQMFFFVWKLLISLWESVLPSGSGFFLAYRKRILHLLKKRRKEAYPRVEESLHFFDSSMG